MNVYADTSFLSSVYLPDAHSSEADRRMALCPNLLASPFGRAEFAVANYRQVFLRRVSEMDARRAWADFEADCRSNLLQTVEFPEAAWHKVVALAERFAATIGVRTLDTLHVACALELHVDKFWTFDERQANLAEAVGLDTKP